MINLEDPEVMRKVEEFDECYNILFLACLSKLIDKIAPWFEPDHHSISKIDLAPNEPNVEIIFHHDVSEDIITKFISKDWFFSAIAEDYPELKKEIDDLVDNFIKSIDPNAELVYCH